MKRRNSGVEFNFDGLTDAVTNLVGSLILLVVLILAVTTPKMAGLTRLPEPENVAAPKRPLIRCWSGFV